MYYNLILVSMQKKRKKGGAGGGPDTSENPWTQLLFGNIDR